MGKVNGVQVENIIKINGKDSTSITRLMGFPTNMVSGWPSAGGCITLSLARRTAPPIGFVCNDTQQDYLFDTKGQFLYEQGESCGGAYASQGYYSDGTQIYRWTEEQDGWVWAVIGPCS